MKRLLPESVKNVFRKTMAFRDLSRRYVVFGRSKMDVTCEVSLLSDGENTTFFGYHDKIPFDLSGRRLLAMSVSRKDSPTGTQYPSARLGYFQKGSDGLFEEKFIPFATSSTWCWQQGCMLQWDPTSPETRAIFNTIVDGQYGAVSMDVCAQESTEEYDAPIYSIAPDGRLASSLNFSRLNRFRPGYGYTNLGDSTMSDPFPHYDGLWLLNRATREKTLVLSLEELATDARWEKTDHYVNHATFSTDGNAVAFLHVGKKSDSRRCVRLCVYNVRRGCWTALENERTVSHYCWCNSEDILATTRDETGRRLTLYNIATKARDDVLELTSSDTHPMVCPVRHDLVVLDTYPDAYCNQHLYLLWLNSRSIERIGTFLSPPSFRGQVKCDLHPRWDREGRCIVVDTAMSGRRQMAMLTLPRGIVQ